MAKISIRASCIFAIWAMAAITGGATTAPSPAPDMAYCSPLIFNNMMDCMLFFANDADEAKPESSCCSGFKKVVETNWDCVCLAISSSASMGMDINMTRVETLPSACGVSAPSITTCYAKPPSTSASPSASPIHPPTAKSPGAAKAPVSEAPAPSPHHYSAPTPVAEAPAPSQHHHYSTASPLSQAPAPSPHHHSGASTISSILPVISTIVFSFSLLA